MNNTKTWIPVDSEQRDAWRVLYPFVGNVGEYGPKGFGRIVHESGTVVFEGYAEPCNRGWNLCGIFFRETDGQRTAEGTYVSYAVSTAPNGKIFLAPLVPSLFYVYFPTKIVVYEQHANPEKTRIFKILKRDRTNRSMSDILDLDLSEDSSPRPPPSAPQLGETC